MQVSVSDSAYGHPYGTVGPTVVAALICMFQTWPTYNVMCNAIRDTCVLLSLREKLLNRARGPLFTIQWAVKNKTKSIRVDSRTSRYRFNYIYRGRRTRNSRERPAVSKLDSVWQILTFQLTYQPIN